MRDTPPDSGYGKTASGDMPETMSGMTGGDYGMPVSEASLKKGYIDLDKSIEALNREYETNENGDCWPKPKPNVKYSETPYEMSDGYYDPTKRGGFLGRGNGDER